MDIGKDSDKMPQQELDKLLKVFEPLQPSLPPDLLRHSLSLRGLRG